MSALSRALLVALTVLSFVAPEAQAAQGPTTTITTSNGSVLVHVPEVAPAIVTGHSIGQDVSQVLIEFSWAVSTPLGGFTVHCAVGIFVVPAQDRVDWSAELCWPIQTYPPQPPPLGAVRVTAHAVDGAGVEPEPFATVTIYVV